MCSQITAVLKNFDAVLAEKNILTSLGNLHIPTLCLYGEHSPHSSRLISQILGDVLPEAKLRLMHGMGHMGPITHARTVNDEIAIFIESQVSDLDEYQVPYAA
jgi:pimeloyl-ACP methyl ester carboxylesterase